MLNSNDLSPFHVAASNKEFEFWQRDSLAVELYTPEVMLQKLEYIHLNPLDEAWNLVSDPADYEFSSSAFYERDSDRFPFLKRIEECI